MTKEEIKSTYDMKDIAARYSLYPNRAGFVRCPFHKGDRDASMKLYDKDFHCFGCGAHGDIFDFVRQMEQVGFQEAFRLLGGTYNESPAQQRINIYRAEKRRIITAKKKQRLQEAKELNLAKIWLYKEWIEKTEPMSEVWCDCYNALQMELYHNESLNGRG